MTTDPTRSVYEARAAEWESRRGPSGDASAFAAALTADHRPVVDLGCGPGWDLSTLGEPAIALDVAAPFLDRVVDRSPDAWPVQADLRHIPFRDRSVGAAWASRSYVHLARSEVPMAWWDLHRVLRIGAPVALHLFPGDLEHGRLDDDDFEGRRFSRWSRPLLDVVLAGAGFDVDDIEERPGTVGMFVVRARRARTLADTVGAAMSVLVVGLNPSHYAADRGVGFARPGNRFWPAARAAGLVTRDRDPADALRTHGVGMTDLVKRATPRADELAPEEYRLGLGRLAEMVGWLRPGVVCVVGLTGWRAATGDPGAVVGLQPRELAGRPVYLMPNPSGANAHATPDDLVTHLRRARRIASRDGG